ncbi:hypothetical protein BC829DRAFT_76888 [Chytridium lagenaria]|nr:hypothetical protein BC829DRAFT_76888 [Chytridium lagenaria]
MYIAGLEAQLEKRQGQVESLENELERARADESRRDIVLVDLERRLRESGNTTESFTRISELEVEVTRYRENLETCQHRIDELMNVEKETLISPPMSVPSSPPLALSRSHESENADLKKRLEEVETALEGCKKRLGVANEDNGALLDRLMEVEKELAESMEEIVKRDESPRGPSVEVSNVELDYVVVKNDLANALKKLADAEFFLAEVNDERVRLTTQFEDLVSQSTSRSHESAMLWMNCGLALRSRYPSTPYFANR